MAKQNTTQHLSRRQLLNSAGTLGLAAALRPLAPAYAKTTGQAQIPALSGNVVDLVIAECPFLVGSRTGTAMTINGTVPGPLIRLKEGQDVTLNVANRLKETASIHWHGVLLPPEMDGVPGVSFAGIKPGTTFTYRFPIKQSGTYWFHSHSGGQEQRGVYAPMIFDPVEPDPVKYDREYVVMLSDWSFASSETMVGDLKKQSGYFNYQQRTINEFFSHVAKEGWKPTVSNYMLWSRMRMDPTDLLDVTSHSYTYLMNGLPSASNWTALFRPGERVRLRFIQVGVMTFQDVRIPGLKMTVVQADGQNVQPVEVDEFRIGPAETYDVIVEPKEDRAYTIFAETLDRSGYARGTLSPRPGMSAAIPERRPRPIRTMKDMGMDMGAMDESSKGEDPKMPGMKPSASGRQVQDLPNMPSMNDRSEIPGIKPVKHGPDHYGSANQATPEFTSSRLDDPGIGLGQDKRRVLVYTDLKSLSPFPDQRQPQRELEIHLTGNMERFMWSLDGKKYSQAKEPVHFRYGERLRWTFVNDTMMEHTMHLHGMWMYLENGTGEYLPRKHTVLVQPAERVSVAITPDTPGHWAFHCHLLLHMEVGMFRVVEVSDRLPQRQS
ncbi:MAG: copper resistance system multicopper oxidase [Acidobacteriota bacterium]|nr:copper resistance system multicopper oxidase [Acidobacteriota bacterium]